jgi:penicillin amidase
MTSSSTSKRRPLFGPVAKLLGILCALVILAVAAYAAYGYAGWRSVAQTSGSVRLPGLYAPAAIYRDDRDVPHIVAGNDHDLYLAQGYAEASDRLFQMDLLRRFVYGRLAEVMGPAALSADENARITPVAAIVGREWAAMGANDRAMLEAFSEGVNAAMTQQPLPEEFHLLFYKPEPWLPQDSLAVSFATVLELIDPWDDVIRRDAVANTRGIPPLDDLYTITDPAYDAPIAPKRPGAVVPLANRGMRAAAPAQKMQTPARPGSGSNEWAAGAANSANGRALLANDPHLPIGIPGVWYLVDLRDGDLHVAGASLPGTPGVLLGHNENVAWGFTNGSTVTEVVYRDPLAGAARRIETFNVRFQKDAHFTYYGTRHGFVVKTDAPYAYAVDWNPARNPVAPLAAIVKLDHAQSVAQAIAAMGIFDGPPQNVAIAGRDGEVAYHLAGPVPRDPSWGLRVHAASDPFYPLIPYDALPHVAASRTNVLYTANDRMYGRGYPYRLSAAFEPPYRARRIETLLSTSGKAAVAQFAAFQLDTFSIPDAEFARDLLAALGRKRVRDARLAPYVRAVQNWNGRFDPQSTGAPVVVAARNAAAHDLAAYDTGAADAAYETHNDPVAYEVLLRVLRERPRGWWPKSDYDALLVKALQQAVAARGPQLLETWGRYGAATPRHPLAALGFSFLNGVTFPGDGSQYSVRVQRQGASQSFRAVWNTGNWDEGGIVIPSGESGEPGSSHYTDQSGAWVKGTLLPLPFSTAAVRAATRATLILEPTRRAPGASPSTGSG